MRGQLQLLQMDLESRVAQRTHELTSAAELSREIVANLQLDHLLPSVTEHCVCLNRASHTLIRMKPELSSCWPTRPLLPYANARLVESGRRQAEQAAALAEREGLAADLHDHLAQTLSFLNLQTDRLIELLAAGHTAVARTELEKLKPAITQAYAQVRTALASLREPTVTPGDPATDGGQGLAENLLGLSSFYSC